jgi:Rrf2 family protein
MISQTSEYALRAALYLAARPDDTPASAQEISEATQVPVGYLQKILRMLARKGILTAHRGTGGGFARATVPSAISVLDVIEASDSQLQRIERCPLGIKGHTRLCALHRVLDEDIARTQQTFASTSLSDLLAGDGGIRPLCDSACAPPAPGTPGGPARRPAGESAES